ncbi:MAG: hypothetical protein KKD73_04890 [Proteobacteria bacterium]|nr:hypothetical protein [Pseudomonadota bacterium]MBU1639888.1 hypothetical protein [Pseudomonadota bacterium]
MNIDSYLESALSDLGDIYYEMATKIEAPVFADVGGYYAWRFKNLSESLACYLKGIKIVSTLNASMVLLRAGFTQEIGALCRMIDDYCNEIFFLVMPQDGDKFSKEQIQFLDDFFKEEFDKPKNPLGSTQKRVNVPIRKIHATFGKLAKEELNPSDAQEILRTTHQAFSGYVHGAYPHIMEMFDGPHPHLNGMSGTPRIDEWRGQLIGYVYRALMMSTFVARKLGLNEMETRARELLEKFEMDTGSKSAKTASELLTAMKKEVS